MMLAKMKVPMKSVWSPEVVVAMWGGLDARPRGAGEYMIRCPFPDHIDKNPSVSLSPGKENGDGAIWYCYACGEGGGVPQFIEAVEGLEKGEGYRRMLMFEISDEFGEAQERSKDIERAEDLPPLRPAGDVWNDGRLTYQMAKDKKAVDGDGWLESIADRYGLDEDLCNLLDFEVHAVMREFDYYVRLRLPSYSPTGELISWVDWMSEAERREYKDDRTRKFAWRRPVPVLGLLDVLSNTEVVVLCEGETDYLQMFGVGLRRRPSWAIVGSPGAGAMAHTTELIFERCDEELPVLVVCGDADEAGDKNSAEAIELWQELGGKAGRMRPPEGTDLRDCLLESEAAAVSAIESAVEYAEFGTKRLVLAH